MLGEESRQLIHMRHRDFGTFGFRLKLGQTLWLMMGANGLESWLEKLARIMELKRWNDKRDGKEAYQKLIFVKNGSGKEENFTPIALLDLEIRKGLPEAGWKFNDLRSLRAWFHKGVSDVICEIENQMDDDQSITHMMNISYLIHQRVIDTGGFPFHAGLVEKDGRGIVLAAPGGTGKSTCCRRIPKPWNPLCDDTSLIFCDNGGAVLAHPYPTWTDYLWRRSEGTWHVERHVPLRGIFFLKQAETDEVIPIGQGEAAIYINQSATEIVRPYWWKLDHERLRVYRKKLFENACELTKVVPAFILHVSLTGQFWKEIEKVLE